MPLSPRSSSSPWLTASLAALVATTLLGCPKRVDSPTGTLEAAAADAESGDVDARTLALAGFHSLLVAGDADKALQRMDAAVGRDPAEPWALYGQVILRQRAAQPSRALEAAFGVVERAPQHPLASAAARFILELVGTSNELDTQILERTGRALESRPRGDAAQLLRTARATIYGQRIDGPGLTTTNAELGSVDSWALAGPLSPFHYLEFDAPLAVETTGTLEGPNLRELPTPDGRLNLSGEAAEGALYAAAADFELTAPGDFILRTVSAAPHKLLLNGTVLVDRRSFARAESTVAARGVRLLAGRHRLLLKLPNEAGAASISVSLMRADGTPTNVKFVPARGAAASWSGVEVADAPGTYPAAASFKAALEDEAGPALSTFIAIRDALGRDPDGAQRLMDGLEQTLAESAAVKALRAELALSDRNIPSRVARARATRDLEAVLEKDAGHVQALLLRAQLAFEDGRQLEAMQLVKRAQKATKAQSHPVPLMRARLELSQGMDAQSQQSAEEALAAQPGLCEALSLLYDLARRRDAVAAADEAARELQGCPGSRTRLAEHVRLRGRIDEAIRLYEGLHALDPTSIGTVQSLVPLYISARRYDDALGLLKRTRELWPRNAMLQRRIGDVLEFAGQPDRALKAREDALALSGGDLALRRQVHRARTGKELLSEYAIDPLEAIRRYEEQGAVEDAPSVMVLDAAAVRVFEDGSMVDRIHIINKALTQEGVDQIGEVYVPAGAHVLALRTRKPDGTVLEPEDIAGKDSISMPGVQVGDYVEQEYLIAHASRGPAQPGFTASSFYFQIAGVPNAWSTYVVEAPKAMGMAVDAHNVASPQPVIEGDRSVYRHEQRNVPPYIPEPDAPPSGTEYLPFVQLGAGTRGNDALVAVYSDAFLDRGQLTSEIEAFAKKAAEGKQGLDAVRAVHSAVMHAVQGQDAGLTVSAASTLAQGRGSRLWALKSSLEAIGVPTRVAVVRSFFADPAPYLFPNETLLPYATLRAELPDGQVVWLDTVFRFGPFGQLPENAANAEAWLLPEPGRPLEKVKTPAMEGSAGKQVTMEVTLSEEGALQGKGEERYSGFEAAQLTEALESLPPDQRKQALQGALARYFGGAELSDLEVELTREVGAPLVVKYAFSVPRFARKEGDKLVLGALTFPVQLGRRYVQLSSRSTPLFIGHPERSSTKVSLRLPKGFKLNGPLGEVKVEQDFGRFVRREVQQGDRVDIEETYEVPMMRLPPKRYDDFAHFAGQVDLIQTRDLLVEPK